MKLVKVTIDGIKTEAEDRSTWCSWA